MLTISVSDIARRTQGELRPRLQRAVSTVRARRVLRQLEVDKRRPENNLISIVSSVRVRRGDPNLF